MNTTPISMAQFLYALQWLLCNEHERDGARGGVLAQTGGRNVRLVAIEHESAMDLVGADEEVVPGGEIHQLAQLFGGPHPPGRIVRVT